MARPFGPEPDKFLQELARDLMQAIGKSLNQSEQVQRVVDRIETEGISSGGGSCRPDAAGGP